MANKSIWPVILSGGAGSRLWPGSRAAYPKQFLPLLPDGPLFEQTLRCICSRPGYEKPVVIGNNDHRFLIAETFKQLGIDDFIIVLEPEGRNTAPAAALAAARIAEEDENALLLVMPSDHLIGGNEAFHEAVKRGARAAAEGVLVTFGIAPDRPQTEYGYIRQGKELAGAGGAFEVASFIGKPDSDKAQQYVGSGEYLWNSGIFLLPLGVLREEFARHDPKTLEAAVRSVADRKFDLEFERPQKEAFLRTNANSFDYAIKEKTERAAVVPVSMGWSDLGSWQALGEMEEKDEAGNALSGDLVARETREDLVFDLRANESTFIPLGAKHRLENPGPEPLHIIEVQSGSYLGEDDIIRFDDDFGRVER